MTDDMHDAVVWPDAKIPTQSETYFYITEEIHYNKTKLTIVLRILVGCCWSIQIIITMEIMWCLHDHQMTTTWRSCDTYTIKWQPHGDHVMLTWSSNDNKESFQVHNISYRSCTSLLYKFNDPAKTT